MIINGFNIYVMPRPRNLGYDVFSVHLLYMALAADWLLYFVFAVLLADRPRVYSFFIPLFPSPLSPNPATPQVTMEKAKQAQ